MLDADPGVVGYLRLSREEEREKGVDMQEKIALRKAILQTIARHNGVCLEEDQITVELMSGGSLAERTGLLNILQRCRSREVHTVVCFDVDRLTRDVSDLKTISNAFFKGDTRLITQRGVHQFDKHFDTTLIQILAVLGEKERRSFSYRRKAANEQRVRSGQWSQGFAAYGYRWDSEYKCFRIDPSEYTILCEIFRRFWHEGANAITNDLNKRGVPCPGDGRRINSAGRWLRGTLANITRNPIYTGYLVKHGDVDREGVTIDLPRGQWIWSEEPLRTLNEAGEWEELPHPVSRDEWEQLQDIRADRQVGQSTKGLLTGLIHCNTGAKMHACHEHYACRCKEQGNAHRGQHVMKSVVERLAWRAVEQFLSTVQIKAPPAKQQAQVEAQAARMDMERRAAIRELKEKEETLQDLMLRSSYYKRLPHYGVADKTGKSNFDRTLEQLAADCESLTRKIGDLAETIERSEIRKASPIIAELSRIQNIEEYLKVIPADSQRTIIRAIVKRIDILPPGPGKQMAPGVRFQFHNIAKGQQDELTLPIVHPRAGVPRGQYRTALQRKGED